MLRRERVQVDVPTISKFKRILRAFLFHCFLQSLWRHKVRRALKVQQENDALLLCKVPRLMEMSVVKHEQSSVSPTPLLVSCSQMTAFSILATLPALWGKFFIHLFEFEINQEKDLFLFFSSLSLSLKPLLPLAPGGRDGTGARGRCSRCSQCGAECGLQEPRWKRLLY